MTKLTNRMSKTNKFGRNMYGTSYLEPVMPDAPAPNYRNWARAATEAGITKSQRTARRRK